MNNNFRPLLRFKLPTITVKNLVIDTAKYPIKTYNLNFVDDILRFKWDHCNGQALELSAFDVTSGVFKVILTIRLESELDLESLLIKVETITTDLFKMPIQEIYQISDAL